MDLENRNLLKQHLIDKKGNVNRNYNIIFKSKPYLLDILNEEFNGLNPQESLYLLSHNMDGPPKCPICSNIIVFNRGYNKTCSKECSKKLILLNSQKTLLKRYGVINIGQSNIIKEKVKQTKLKRYGEPYYHNVNKMKQTKLERYGATNYVNPDKMKQTKLERYGNSNYVNTNKIKQTKLERYGDPYYRNANKMKQTKLERYGNSNYVNSNKAKQTKLERYGDANYNNREQTKRTCLERYGAENFVQSEEWQKIIKNEEWQKHRKEAEINTKRKNHTFNTSKPEENGYKLLCDKYGVENIKRQYKSELYPFACDFYVKSLDLYIEFNFHWTHGGHLYNNNNIKDIITKCRLNIKSKTSKFYKIALNVWCKADVNKYNVAKKNNLNYLAFYTWKEFLEWYERER